MSEDKGPISIFHDLKMVKPASPIWPESANVYLFEDEEGITLFDVGCGSITSVERLFRAVKALGWHSKSIKKIILSHAHPDHIGGMEAVLSHNRPESVILHENDLSYALDPERLMHSFDIPLCNKRLQASGSEEKKGSKESQFDLIEYFNACGCSMSRARPDRIVMEGDFIKAGAYQFEVFNTPGHAPGHISLYDREKRILLSGDILGEIVAWYSPSSGGVTGYLESLEKIEVLDIDLILPSHGHVITDSGNAIQETREKILEKERGILEALQAGEKTFGELMDIFFHDPIVRFFPGIPILESHLQKLIGEERIQEKALTYSILSLC